jgi:hypothetical protein
MAEPKVVVFAGGRHGAAIRLGLKRTTLLSAVEELGIPHPCSAPAYRQEMRQRFDTWQAITSVPTAA